MSEEITITASDGGKFQAYLASPNTDIAPGIIVIQEIFGVNETMRGLADGYAAAGYVVIVPDLFWRQDPGVQLNDHNEADVKRAFELYEGFDEDQGVADLVATLDTLIKLDTCLGRIGTVGFCLGGKLAYLMATRSTADCNVSYYGVGIENNLDEADKITKPTLLHLAQEDEFVSTEAQTQIQGKFQDHDYVTVHRYAGVNHGFARPRGQNYAQNATAQANLRTLEFFKQHLGGGLF